MSEGRAAPHSDRGGRQRLQGDVAPGRLLADELCLDALMPDAVANALPVIRRRCEEIGRDPASLCRSRFTSGASRRP
jgi:hypothetical protein